jgi:hypothetical protein
MALHIGEKIEAVSRRIRGDEPGTQPDPDFAFELAEAAIAAMSAGMGNAAGEVPSKWETLMRIFTNDQTELDRLCGRDQVFMNSQWGKFCLAYIAGDSVCTSETTMRGGTKRSMLLVDQLANPPRRMLEILDAQGVDLQTIDAEVRAAEAAAKALNEKSPDSGNTDPSSTETPDERNE